MQVLLKLVLWKIFSIFKIAIPTSGFKIATYNVHGWCDDEGNANQDRVLGLYRKYAIKTKPLVPFFIRGGEAVVDFLILIPMSCHIRSLHAVEVLQNGRS
jgi:hypothetical protein